MLAVVGLAGIVVAIVGLTRGPNLRYVAAGLGLPLPYVESASKWSKARGIPLDWVLATILVESGGNPSASGDSDGRSVGLMQINSVAHAKEVTREQLLNPDTNIAWGTKFLREFRDGVTAAAGSRPLPAPLDVLTRLAYKGPAYVYNALKRGEDPTKLAWAPAAIANWQKARTRVAGAEAVGKARLSSARPRTS